MAIDEVLTESSVRVGAFLASPSPGPADQAARCELLLRLADGIGRLPPDQRDAVNLWAIHGYKTGEIAALLEKTPKAVAGLLRRGLEGVQKFATDLGLEPP